MEEDGCATHNCHTITLPPWPTKLIIIMGIKQLAVQVRELVSSQVADTLLPTPRRTTWHQADDP
jgi:hypothetical protein